MDQLESLRFFLKLSETLSFKQTADHFGVPPSKISRSLKALETHLGVPLVERTTRRVRLTETGHWYRSEVSSPLRALNAADAMAQAHSLEPAGNLRMTALPGYGEIRLTPVLDAFRQAYPNVVCDIEFSDRYLDLSTGEIDIALRATAAPPDYLIAKRLHSHRFVLVASPEYLRRRGTPSRVDEMMHHDAIGYRGRSGVTEWRAVRENGDVVQVPRKLTLVSNSGIFMRRAALAGGGMVFLPSWGISEALEAGTLCEVTFDDAELVLSNNSEMSLYLLYPPEKSRLGKVRAMVDFLTSSLGDEATDIAEIAQPR